MSTNKSQNLNLHLWEPNDDFLRTEFNENFAAIDSSVKSVQTAAANAQTAADAAHTEAVSLPYVIGSYTGTGENITINVGFRPRLLILTGGKENRSGMGMVDLTCYLCITGGHVISSQVILTDTGFTARNSSATGNMYPDITEKGRAYDFIAFK